MVRANPLLYMYIATICVNCDGAILPDFKGVMTMVRKIGVAAAVALVAFLAAPNASFAASKKSQSAEQSQSAQRGPYTPDIVTQKHGASRDFQGGSQYYKRSKTKKHQ